MTTPFFCLFLGCVIPYALAPVAAFFKVRQFGSVDINTPRAQSAALEGTGALADHAQSNAWEALAVFTAAVVTNHVNGGDPEISATLAMVWVAARVAHAVAYIANIALLRSGVFVIGFGSAIALFFV